MSILALLSTKRHLIHYLVALSLIRIEYPYVRRDDSVVDDYFGTKIPDPYRWLEDLDSEETRKFVQQQQNLTNTFLQKIPTREAIRKRLTEMWNFPTSSAPEKAGMRYFSLENSGLQSQSIMYVQDSLDGPKSKFLDPNAFSEDGTVALSSYAFSRDGELFSYAISQSGSDWKIVRFKSVGNMTDLQDVLLYTKWPDMSWSVDAKGIFYMRYPSPKPGKNTTTSENGQIFYHKIGTRQEEDILVIEFPESPKRHISPSVSACGEYILIKGEESNNATTLFIGDLRQGIDETLKSRIIAVFPFPYEAIYEYIINEGSTFMFLTNKDAPNGKLITVSIQTNECQPISYKEESRNPGCACSPVTMTSTFLEENKTRVIDWALPFDSDKLIVCYVEDVKHKLEIRSLKDASLLESVALPAGKISTFHRENKTSNEFFFRLRSFVSPGTIYRCYSTQGFKCEVLKQIEVGTTDFSKIIMEQVFFPSKDGTKVPMYILRHHSVPLDGSAPALLYGYGGFGINIMPDFSTEVLLFVENFRGIYVSANIRGGNEYGEKWHAEGSLLNKQNVFDDFQAGAEFLIRNNYSTSAKLTINGGSNGGLLVGACVNQRPDLYGAAVAQVGVMDMLRFQHFTIGYTWCLEYGCSNDEKFFKYLLKYSPLHNIRVPLNDSVQYPAVLVTTADHDDRVVPSHTFKYIAELQHTIGSSPKQTNPLLLRVETKAGHGAGKPTSMRINEIADIYAFIQETLCLEFRASWN